MDHAVSVPHDYTCFRRHIGVNCVANLAEHGYAVVDGMFGGAWATGFRDEIVWLHEQGIMRPNETQFHSVSQGHTTKRFTKPNIFELDLHHAAARRLVPMFDDLFKRFQPPHADLVRALHAHAPSLKLAESAASTTIKLQYNQGSGGCFPLHYDNPGRPNKRKITCLVYLNPSWKQGDGGELELVPFCGQKVVIPPLHDRVVLFHADRVLHRVLPAQAPRCCFTIWLDGTGTNEDEDVLLRQKHLSLTSEAAGVAGAVSFFRASGLQRQLSRSVYKEAYALSLKECQGHGSECMVESHNLQVTQSLATPALARLVQQLRTFNEAYA